MRSSDNTPTTYIELRVLIYAFILNYVVPLSYYVFLEELASLDIFRSNPWISLNWWVYSISSAALPFVQSLIVLSIGFAVSSLLMMLMLNLIYSKLWRTCAVIPFVLYYAVNYGDLMFEPHINQIQYYQRFNQAPIMMQIISPSLVWGFYSVLAIVFMYFLGNRIFAPWRTDSAASLIVDIGADSNAQDDAKMKCMNCGKLIFDLSIKDIDGRLFCNNLCRIIYKKALSPNSTNKSFDSIHAELDDHMGYLGWKLSTLIFFVTFISFGLSMAFGFGLESSDYGSYLALFPSILAMIIPAMGLYLWLTIGKTSISPKYLIIAIALFFFFKIFYLFLPFVLLKKYKR